MSMSWPGVSAGVHCDEAAPPCAPRVVAPTPWLVCLLTWPRVYKG